MNNVMVLKEKLGNKKALMTTVITSAMVTASAFPAFADTDIAAELTTSFQATADTMVATIFAVLPVIMSVFSAYLCIQFGFKFFRRFAK